MVWTCETCGRPKAPQSASRFDEALISRLALHVEVDADEFDWEDDDE